MQGRGVAVGDTEGCGSDGRGVGLGVVVGKTDTEGVGETTPPDGGGEADGLTD